MSATLRTSAAGLLTLALGFAHAGGAFAQAPVGDFYRGKTITITIGFPPGGEYDLHGRLVGRFIGKHIPGNPQVIATTMTGAGGITLTNHLYNVAAKDGTQLGVVANGIAAAQAIGTKGLAFDANKLNFIGTLVPTIEVVGIWHTWGVTKLEQVMQKEYPIGASGRGAGSFIMPTVMNEMFGAKFKIVTGYRGGPDMNVAMERGEIAARSNSWTSWKTTKADWLAERKVALIAYAGPEAADLAGVPHLNKLAKTPADRQVLDLVFNGAGLGRPIVGTPGIPAERVAALRAAFDALLKDPEFVAAAIQAKIELIPIRGVDMQKTVADALSAPKDVVARAKDLME